MGVSSASHPPEPPRDAFWRFSLDFCGRPGVAAACLDLQDGHGRDVNLVLFACWVGLSGRGRLAPAALATADAALEPWRRKIVAPLRVLRRRVKATADAAALYAALKAAELEAERVTQDRLDVLAPAAAEPPRQTRIADALANLALYLGQGAAFDAAAPIRLALATETTQ
jgi:uncharacterized protein (TIGR02444 family)